MKAGGGDLRLDFCAARADTGTQFALVVRPPARFASGGLDMSKEEDAFRQVVRGNLERIEFAYQRALEDGLTDLAVLVVDIRDRHGQRIAEALTNKTEVSRRLEKSNANELDFFLIQPMARNEVVSFLLPFISTAPTDTSSLNSTSARGEFAIGVISCNMLGWTTHRLPK